MNLTLRGLIHLDLLYHFIEQRTNYVIHVGREVNLNYMKQDFHYVDAMNMFMITCNN